MAYTYKKRVNTDSSHSAGFPGGSPFSKNSKTGGNCTWWAWGRFKEVYKLATGKSLSWTAGSGNACAFYRIMGKAGYRTGKTPKPGAIICWGYNGKAEGNPGHVAFVEQVYSNGDIEISQSGWSSGPLANKKITKSSGYKFGWNNDHFNGFIYNKVEFTNPDGSIVSGSALGASAHDTTWYVDKYGTGAEVYFALSSYGYSHKACCAVLGNMQQESGIRVKTGGSFDGMGSEGLCQWTGGRKTSMQKYAKQHSKTGRWDSVDGQVAYLHYELTNSEKNSGKVLANDSLSLEQMTEEFEKKFERAGIPNMPARIKYAQEWDSKMQGAGVDGEYGIVEAVVDMRQRSEQLYSSEGYNWIEEAQKIESEEEKKNKERMRLLRDFLRNINITLDDSRPTTSAIPDYISMSPTKTSGRLIKVANSIVPVSEAMVEAPFVEVDFNGTVIGTVKNSLDDYPNHISSLEITKINGQINQYSLNIIHQIRPGEDPNLLDKVISKVRYDRIHIKYGDYNSNVIYGDDKAIITNVAMNRDYVGNKISYTISATSAGSLITSYKVNFPAKTDKPSNVISDVLYNNIETSSLMLESFPGMKNKSAVYANNLIPTNDAVLDIDEKYNISPIEYVNYLTSCMSNAVNDVKSIIRNSSYYISYENDFYNQLGGAFFAIREVVSNTLDLTNGNNIYSITVGYPDNNFVMGFTVDNDIAWSILYENSSIADEYVYSIDDKGNQIQTYSPNIMSSSVPMNEIQKNWWTQMTHFPLTASVKLKGLMKPAMLMDYVIVDVVFYGQRHITSGVYVITGQKDTLSGEGFRTTLSLTRVGAN